MPQSVPSKDKEVHIPIWRDSLFRNRSMTKPVTTAAAMILVEEGKIRLPHRHDIMISATILVTILQANDVLIELAALIADFYLLLLFSMRKEIKDQ